MTNKKPSRDAVIAPAPEIEASLLSDQRQPHRSMYTQDMTVRSIGVRGNLRPVSEPAVNDLAESMKTLGQLQPITVWRPNGYPLLVAGLHRLEAAKRLGWETIRAIVLPADTAATDVELTTIAENLHRAELTALERDEQVTRWVELVSKKHVQAEQVSMGGRGKKSGEAQAARELGLSRPDVHRAGKVASLSGAAKDAAREVGLDGNRTALLKAAKETTPEAQVLSLRKKAAASVKESAPSIPKRKADVGQSTTDEPGSAQEITAPNDGLYEVYLRVKAEIVNDWIRESETTGEDVDTLRKILDEPEDRQKVLDLFAQFIVNQLKIRLREISKMKVKAERKVPRKVKAQS